MTTVISLAKRKELVTISLAKKAITFIPPVKIVTVLDTSGSMHGAFSSTPASTFNEAKPSVMQSTFDRMLAVAAKMDDDGTMEVYAFDNYSYRLPDADLSDYGGYLYNNIERAGMNWGGTSYVPVIRDVLAAYGTPVTSSPAPTSAPAAKATSFFGKVKSLFSSEPELVAPTPAAVVATTATTLTPAVVLFFTDGASSDGAEAERLLRQVADMSAPIYFHMIGVGNPSDFGALKGMADRLPNVGFVSLSSFTEPDEVVYDKLITAEFAAWLKKHAGAK